MGNKCRFNIYDEKTLIHENVNGLEEVARILNVTVQVAQKMSSKKSQYYESAKYFVIKAKDDNFKKDWERVCKNLKKTNYPLDRIKLSEEKK